MNLMSHPILAALLAVSFAAAGCSKDEAAPETTEPAPTEAAEPAAPEPVEPAPKAAAAEHEETEAALGEYETIRAALAKDDVAAAIEAATSLKEAADSAAASAPDAHRPHLEALSEAAEALAAIEPEDAAAARKTFGEASRAVVALLADAPELREGRHVFECSMASGYKKWVQTDEEIANPYMGTKMLSCGSGTEWEIGG